ncbi:MAG: DUF1559 domain-containing protein [Chthoniobacterales bacterium]
MKTKARKRAFSLLELLVVITILTILLIIGGSAATSIFTNTKRMECISKMRSIGVGIQQYAQDNSGQFPPSGHSAAAARKSPWHHAILPYMGFQEGVNFKEIANSALRCPCDTNTSPYIYSYALNVYFELKNGDDYEGAPATWHRQVNVPHPTKTILLAETKPIYFGDHLMVHQWKKTSAAENSLAGNRHGGPLNFLFVDGHVAPMEAKETFDTGKKINLWNPSLAGKIEP